jgi:hypothetical protein
MSYTSSTEKDFLPANLGIGLGYKLHLDPKDDNTIGFYADFNKLLVPTPDTTIGNNGGYALSQHQRSESPITGLVTSFYDAPGGATEELKSISAQIGAEYFFRKMFGLRVGYFYEDPTKGNRNFMTVGATIKYNVATLHMSYLVPTTNMRNPLDNTFSFSLTFEFSKSGVKKRGAEPVNDSGTTAPDSTPKAKRATKTAPTPTTPPVNDGDPTKQ